MPRTTAEEGSKWALPKGDMLPAELTKVEERSFDWIDRTGDKRTTTLWNWTFKITSGEYEGLHAYGETTPKVSKYGNARDQVGYQWVTALRDGYEPDLGEDIDTDDLIGVPCFVICDQTERTKKDGTVFYGNPVTQVLPPSAEEGEEAVPF